MVDSYNRANYGTDNLGKVVYGNIAFYFDCHNIYNIRYIFVKDIFKDVF